MPAIIHEATPDMKPVNKRSSKSSPDFSIGFLVSTRFYIVSKAHD
jgi:hypothetical protein